MSKKTKIFNVSNNNTELNPDLITVSLEDIRKKLLPTNGKNKLIKFSHNKTSDIRAIEVAIDDLVNKLLDGKEFSFLAIPEPTEEELLEHGYLEIDEEGETVELKAYPKAEQWAKILGYDTSYEQKINTKANKENNIQTIVYQKKLDAQLNLLKRKANECIKETGSNALYIMFGFLEWLESENSDRKFLAPLYSIPISIEKKSVKLSVTQEYVIKYTGEEITTNLPLAEKLRDNFGIMLPHIEEKQPPNKYFAKITKATIKYKTHNWQIKNFVSLSICDFASSMMYKDLDPRRWPSGSGNIKNHDIIKQFFTSKKTNNSSLGSAKEYIIDHITDIHELFPLIDKADSSQHSALIDAVKGKNLVIEGPPGTGKSQTITNLIAAVLAQGKTVLFVAEKMTALEVVKDRLEKAGLGDFCLELHSHKTQKKLVYQNLQQRIITKFNKPEDIDITIALYEDRKNKLNAYEALVNSNWKKTEKTIHQILTSATKYKQEFDQINLTNIDLTNINGLSFTKSKVVILIEDLKHYESTYKDMLKDSETGELTNHPWFGVHNHKLTEADYSNIKQTLENWNQSINAITEVLPALEQQLLTETNDETFNQLTTIACLSVDYPKLPKFTDHIYLPALVKLTAEQIASCKNQLQQYYKGKDVFDKLDNFFNLGIFNQQDTLEHLAAANAELNKLITDKPKTLDDISTQLTCLTDFKDLTNGITSAIEQVTQNNNSLTKLLPYNYTGFVEFQKYCNHIITLDKELITRRDRLFDNPQLASTLAELQQDINNINSAKTKVNSLFNLDNLASVAEIEELQQIFAKAGILPLLFNKSWRLARKKLLSLATGIKPNFKNLITLLPNLIAYKKLLDYFFTKEQNYTNLLKHEYQGLNTNTYELLQLWNWYQQVRKEYGTEHYQQVRFANSLFTTDAKIFIELQQSTNSWIIDVTEFMDLRQQLAQTFNHNIFIDKNYFIDNTDITNLYNNIEGNIKTIQQLCKYNINLEKLENNIDLLRKFIQQQADFNENKTISEIFTINLCFQKSFISEIKSINASLEYATAINQLATTELQAYLRQQADKTQLNLLQSNLYKLQQAYENFMLNQQQFIKIVELNNNEWFSSINDNINSLAEHNTTALTSFEYLISWVNFIKLKPPLEQQGLKPLLQLLENKKITYDKLADAYLAIAYNILVKEILTEKPLIADFSPTSHENIQRQFAEYDQQLTKLQRQKIAYVINDYSDKKIEWGISSGKVSNYTEIGLINHEIGKLTRHIPIRQLIKRAPKSIVALKPCFMMSPVSVAQYLEPGALEFDLVIMDEASQIKPEHALGAIARSKQVVIVGDPKQLPPTNYFATKTESDNEEEKTAAEQLESILDVSLAMFKLRRLCWHYRSRHQSLIAFSNQKFYDNNLIIFPSPQDQNYEFGIKFQYINFGVFNNGCNVKEAQIVAKAVSNHLINHPHESIGVVAMNKKQQEFIAEELNNLATKNTKLQQALVKNENSDNPLFIKNLESVQGDERDVIYISFTYGPQQPGSRNVAQRFGPINSEAGGRRMNVLLTRSKKRMHIFSSMQASDIRLTEKSSTGVIALKNFLDYAATGNLPKQYKLTDREPDSDFEISVMQQLQQAGFEVVPQLGVNGFFIDLAVRDPNQPDKFILGIECDGASYHSAKSARDRDILRQGILEDLGWRIERIWSTDWFYNPKAQIKRIVTILHQLKTQEVKIVDVKTEVDEVTKIIVAEQQTIIESKKFVDSSTSLQQALENFDAEIISPELSNTDPNKKLLRPAMIEALVEHLPASKEEFQQSIPEYLRKGTEAKQGKFLDKVLHIIEGYTF
jgi:very-short-patch-repair endonuclease